MHLASYSRFSLFVTSNQLLALLFLSSKLETTLAIILSDYPARSLNPGIKDAGLCSFVL